MPRPPALATYPFVNRSRWQLKALPVALALVAVATTAGGISLLVLRAQSMRAGQVLAPAGIVLLACSVAQWRTAWLLWHRRGDAMRTTDPVSWTFLRRFFLGAFLAYASAVVIGPAKNIEYCLLAVVVAWYTLLLLPLAGLPLSLDRVKPWWPIGAVRLAGWLALASILVLIGAEAGLSAYSFLRDHGTVPRLSQPNGGQRVDQPGMLTDGTSGASRVARLSPGPLRVAVLCDQPAASTSKSSDYLARVEQALPGVQIVPIELPQPWSSEPSGEVAQRLSQADADLALAVLPVCADLVRKRPEPSWFDWRQFELAQLIGAPPVQRATASPMPPRAEDFESFCRRLAPQLAACRTPIEGPMHDRWEQTLRAVDRLVSDCNAADVSVALVLVPGEFQVNRGLCDTLSRRAGYEDGQLDVDLPQRKLASFAMDRHVPLIDLLPALRLCDVSPYERNAGTWNQRGHAAAATAIGGWLESRYGRQLSVSAQLTSAP